MKCKSYCDKEANYVVINDDIGIDASLEKDLVYCLRHARNHFRTMMNNYRYKTVALIKLTKVAVHHAPIEVVEVNEI